MGKKQLSADKRPGVFNQMLKTFLDYIISARGFSYRTKESYKTAFRLLLIYIWEHYGVRAENITFSLLDTAVMEGYFTWLESSRKNSISTRNIRLAAINSFSKYAVNHDFEAASYFQNVMTRIEHKKGMPAERAYFTTKEVKILIDLPKLNTNSGRRDATLLTFMFATAARAQEICDLKVRDIEWLTNQRGRITLHGKGNKSRKITISPEVTRVLARYMRFRQVINVPDAYVFCTQNRPQMSLSCLEAIFKKYSAQAKKEYPELFHSERYTPHSMRHTTAVSMLAANVPLSVIKVFLGHNQISTTEIYAQITQPALEEEITRWNDEFWSDIKNKNQQDNIPKIEHSASNGIIPDYLL